MNKKCPKCRVEKRNILHENGWCKKCYVSHMMMSLIIKEYVESKGKPDRRMELMMMELDFLYKRNTTLFGYLNTATEVCFDLVFSNEAYPKIEISELDELNHSRLPNDEILKILEKSLLINIDDGHIVPGNIIEKIRTLRLAEISIRSEEFHAAITEMIGLIAVALTKALFEIYGVEEGRGSRFPRSAMAVLHLLAHLIIEADENNQPINKELALEKYFELMTKMLTPRQRKFFLYQFISFIDGRARILKDYDDENKNLIIDDVVVDFLERIRELIREYEREREDRTL